ncbi:MAG: hypothetical protein U1E78_13085 [Gammaproteobacteria bacterium]
MYEERMAKYLHLPLQILWFDSNEVALIFILYIMALCFGGLMWVALVVLPFPLIRQKRQMSRGYFQHTIYQLGWMDLKGYPVSSARTFYE